MPLFCRLSDLLLNLGSLTGAATQVEQLRTANLTAANNLNLLNEGGVHGEHALYANAVGRTANGKGLSHAAMLLGDYSALEGLDTLTLAFLDANGNANGVANFELCLLYTSDAADEL